METNFKETRLMIHVIGLYKIKNQIILNQTEVPNLKKNTTTTFNNIFINGWSLINLLLQINNRRYCYSRRAMNCGDSWVLGPKHRNLT